MVEVFDQDDNVVEKDKVARDMNEAAVPDPVGVYDRPERAGGGFLTLIAAFAIILLLILIAYSLFLV